VAWSGIAAVGQGCLRVKHVGMLNSTTTLQGYIGFADNRLVCSLLCTFLCRSVRALALLWFSNPGGWPGLFHSVPLGQLMFGREHVM